MEKICLKCGHIRDSEDGEPDYSCPKCGVVYEKVEKQLYDQKVAAIEEKNRLEQEVKNQEADLAREKLGRRVVTKTYTGKQQEAMQQFHDDAEKMAEKNYFPTSQTWAAGSYGAGMFLLALILAFFIIGILIFIYMLIVKPAGALSVTYELKNDQIYSDESELVHNIVIKTRIVHEDYDYSAQFDENKDAWEGGIWDADDLRKVDAYIEIEYRDAKLQETKRRVRVESFSNSMYDGALLGFCELRQANRNFRFDRVLRCVDIETGEDIQDIRSFLNEKYQQAPERIIEVLLDDYDDLLKTLFYVAKADNQFKKAEKIVITEYLKKVVGDDRLTIKIVTDAFGFIGNPSIHVYKRSLNSLMKEDIVDMDDLKKCLHGIVGTQNTVHPAEKEALEYYDKKCASVISS